MIMRDGQPEETPGQAAAPGGDPPPPEGRASRGKGLGLITGAADADCSAIGTYASAGARLGPSFLWTAPVALPMMVTVVYLSAKLGLVTGQGLFAVIRAHYPRWLLSATLIGAMIGNTIEAAADLGGMAATLNLFIPLPVPLIVVLTAAVILALQLWGSYLLIRKIFRWLALALLAYIPAALLAKPDFHTVLKGTLIPSLHFNLEFLSLLVAVIGTTLSAYLYTWQSNQEVEEKIARRQKGFSEREGATPAELKRSWWDIFEGMFFSGIAMYFIMLATASTLFPAGKTDINTAAEAAQALRPFAGRAAELFFAIGVVGVGFLAVPIMTTGAAYDLCQALGWRHNSLNERPREAKAFYIVIVLVTVVAVAINFLGFNPIKALVWSGIVQGFSAPPLLLLIMLMTNNRKIMGTEVNGRAMNVLGWVTTGAVFAATLGLVVSWMLA